jgi:1-acyl-sn-glycerol-3-phosphate acyltransferase
MQNLRHLKRTDFHITVGNPFRLNTDQQRITPSMRQQILDEIMYQLASLLPPYYRGVYANLNEASQKYLEFLSS